MRILLQPVNAHTPGAAVVNTSSAEDATGFSEALLQATRTSSGAPVNTAGAARDKTDLPSSQGNTTTKVNPQVPSLKKNSTPKAAVQDSAQTAALTYPLPLQALPIQVPVQVTTPQPTGVDAKEKQADAVAAVAGAASLPTQVQLPVAVPEAEAMPSVGGEQQQPAKDAAAAASDKTSVANLPAKPESARVAISPGMLPTFQATNVPSKGSRPSLVNEGADPGRPVYTQSGSARSGNAEESVSEITPQSKVHAAFPADTVHSRTDTPVKATAGSDDVVVPFNATSMQAPVPQADQHTTEQGVSSSVAAVLPKVQTGAAADTPAASQAGTQLADVSTAVAQVLSQATPSAPTLSTLAPKVELGAPVIGSAKQTGDAPSAKSRGSIQSGAAGRSEAPPSRRKIAGSDAQPDADEPTAKSIIAAKVAPPVQTAADSTAKNTPGNDFADMPSTAQPAQQANDGTQAGTASFPSAAPHSPTATASKSVADINNLPGVSTAQLIQSAHHSEMKLGMQSAEFGNISINTSLNHQSLSAQILTDHSELGRALAVHLPAIEAKLGSAYGVQAKVELRDAGTSAGNSASNHDGTRQQERQQARGTAAHSSALSDSFSTFRAVPQTAHLAAESARLDVRI